MVSIIIIIIIIIIVLIQFLVSIYLPFYVIFIKNRKKQGIAIFSTGYPSWNVVEELQRAVAANPEEIAVGTDPNID